MNTTRVNEIFKNWIKFMKDNGPMGTGDHLSTDEFSELRKLIKKELEQLDEDDSYFNYGAMS